VTISDPVLNIDLAPTIADAAGLDIPDSVDGASLLPMLKGDDENWRDAVLIEHWPTEEGFGGTIPRYVAIRTDEWKYVRYDTGELELYDLVNDPYEIQNLAGDAAYASVMADLDVQLDALAGE
jgi:N-acetylglucosamine-6-sulfatase